MTTVEIITHRIVHLRGEHRHHECEHVRDEGVTVDEKYHSCASHLLPPDEANLVCKRHKPVIHNNSCKQDHRHISYAVFASGAALTEDSIIDVVVCLTKWSLIHQNTSEAKARATHKV